VPEHLRDGRFGDWLDNARDWAVSRNRFWGTPLPIWRNAEGEVVCVGSAAELAERAGVPVDDLHLDAIGGITIPSQRGGTALRQTGGVLDCWFESGSMPYAQWGYPQEGRAQLEVGFPADFIAEGLDQTRGWFYTLTVIGAALFGKSPFQHVVVNGLILAEDGKKMSKRLKNYPDPAALLESHGADAIRLYLIDSPAVKAEPLRFSEAGVREIVRKILLRWWNAYSFFVSYANIDGFVPRGDAARSENLLDQWVLSRLHTLIHHANAEMAAYRLYKVVPALEEMIEDLTNTYIRFAREHFWADGMPEDKRYAYETLYTVLATLAKVMAPFTPFLAEAMHRNLAAVAPGAQESVHLERYPDADEALRRPELEAAVARMTQLVVMGRNLRERLGIKAKIPLNRMWVIHRDAEVLTSLRALEPYFAAELGVREVIYTDRERDFIAITTKAHFPRLGPRLGKRMGQVAGAIAKLTDAEVATLEHGGALEVAGERITLDDVDVRRAPRSDADAQTLAAHALVSIRLDPEVTAAQIDEGRLRELLRLVQSARKDADLPFDARIDLQLHAPPALAALVAGQTERVLATTLARSLVITAEPAGDHVKRGEVDDEVVVVALTVVG
jgi:isoleucyl-tRNA synthetase